MTQPLLVVRSRRAVTETIAPAAIHIRAGTIERVAAWDGNLRTGLGPGRRQSASAGARRRDQRRLGGNTFASTRFMRAGRSAYFSSMAEICIETASWIA